MNILISNKQKDLKIDIRRVKTTLKELIAFLKIETDEISIQFVTETKICKLHEEFFNDQSSTDCITFPLDGLNDADYHVLGEVFICPKTAKAYALSHNLDFYEELTLYLVHGVLHLIGFGDRSSSEKVKMRSNEKKCMNFLKKHDILLK